MQRPSKFALVVAFPSLPILIYLAMHATEGWQLLVVATFLGGFVASWLWHSKAVLLASYAVTISLFAWVAWVNL